MVRPLLEAFTKTLKESCLKFGAYFEDNYTADHVFKRWLRPVYLARYPPELHRRVPTGTQHGESNIGHIKTIDLADKCVSLRRSTPLF